MSNLSTNGIHGRTAKGYLRYWASSKSMVYEHIAVARVAWGPRVPWPRGCHVHHMDGQRAHNCRQNLLIIAGELHDGRMHRKGK